MLPAEPRRVHISMARVAPAAIPVALALALVAVRVACGPARAQFPAAFAQPLPVVTAWGGHGVLLVLLLASALALTALPYAFAVRAALAARPGEVALGIVLAAAFACLVACASSPVVFSSDVYAYAWYGAEAARGLNPYVPHSVLTAAAGGTALDRAVAFEWGALPPACIYGPLFLALATAATRLAGENPVIALWLLRAASAAAFLGCIVLIGRLAGAGSARGRAAAVAFGLNPAVVWSVAEGHNDALALLPALIALTLLRRPFWAGAMVVAAAAVKLSALAALAPALLSQTLSPRSRRGFGYGVAAGVLCFGASLRPLAEGLAAMRPHGSTAPHPSLAWLVEYAVRPLWGTAAAPAGWAFALGAALAASLLALRLAREGDRRWLPVAALAACCALPQLYPWYFIWVAAAGCVACDTPAGVAALAATFPAVLRYLPDASSESATTLLAPLAALILVPVMVLAVARAARSLPIERFS